MVDEIITLEQVRKKYYTYILAYPDNYISADGIDLSNIVFYCGKGTMKPGQAASQQRINFHEAEVRSHLNFKFKCRCIKCKVIKRIWEVNKEVYKAVIYETDIEKDALLHEWVMINMIYASPHLTNTIGNVYHWERVREKQHRDIMKARAEYDLKSQQKRERTYCLSPESQVVLVELAQQDGLSTLEYLEQLIKSQSVQRDLVSEVVCK